MSRPTRCWGNYEEAVKHYQQTDLSNVYAKYHLALAQEAAGFADKARQLFDEVANYNFNDVGFALVREEAAAKAGSGGGAG